MHSIGALCSKPIRRRRLAQETKYDHRLRNLYKHLQKFKFSDGKEDLRTAETYKNDDLAFTLDLKGGHHGIEINKAYWKYFGFLLEKMVKGDGSHLPYYYLDCRHPQLCLLNL